LASSGVRGRNLQLLGRVLAAVVVAIALVGCGAGLVPPPYVGPPAFDSSILGPLGKAEVAGLRLSPPGFSLVPHVGDRAGQPGWYSATANADYSHRRRLG
jgi:hypothetical protein